MFQLNYTQIRNRYADNSYFCENPPDMKKLRIAKEA